MKDNLFKYFCTISASIITFIFAILIFYVWTDLGFNNNPQMPTSAPLWFEAIITTIFFTITAGMLTYDYLNEK